jgi:hypothetical protein
VKIGKLAVAAEVIPSATAPFRAPMLLMGSRQDCPKRGKFDKHNDRTLPFKWCLSA